MPTAISYGPYYRSARRATDIRRRALGYTGMSPGEVAAERFGEISAISEEQRSRRAENRAAEIAAGQLGIAARYAATAERQAGIAETGMGINLAHLKLSQREAEAKREAEARVGATQLLNQISEGGSVSGLGEGRGTATGFTQGQGEVTVSNQNAITQAQARATGQPTRFFTGEVATPFETQALFATDTAARIGIPVATYVNPAIGAIAGVAYAAARNIGYPLARYGVNQIGRVLGLTSEETEAMDISGVPGQGISGISTPGWGEDVGYNVDISGFEGQGYSGISTPGPAWGEEAGFAVDVGADAGAAAGGAK